MELKTIGLGAAALLIAGIAVAVAIQVLNPPQPTTNGDGTVNPHMSPQICETYVSHNLSRVTTHSFLSLSGLASLGAKNRR